MSALLPRNTDISMLAVNKIQSKVRQLGKLVKENAWNCCRDLLLTPNSAGLHLRLVWVQTSAGKRGGMFILGYKSKQGFGQIGHGSDSMHPNIEKVLFFTLVLGSKTCVALSSESWLQDRQTPVCRTSSWGSALFWGVGFCFFFPVLHLLFL